MTRSAFASIVVGTDGSATAALAIEQAVRLAHDSGAELHLVTAYRLTGAQFVAPEAAMAAAAVMETQAEQERQATQAQADLAGRLRKDGLAVKTHVCPGDPADVIIDIAEAERADLIVV